MSAKNRMKAQVVARRTTFDGVALLLWSDGAITNRLGGSTVRGRVPLARLWETAGWVATYRWDELAGLVQALRRGAPFLGTVD
jgi:hypothetical protein